MVETTFYKQTFLHTPLSAGFFYGTKLEPNELYIKKSTLKLSERIKSHM